MFHNLIGFSIVFFVILTRTLVLSKTDTPDVSALTVMFNSLNSPSQLTGWKSSGGDPCGDSWKGIKCSGSSVTEINLSGLGLTGSMGYQLSSLTSVKNFDLSKNNLKGDIPYQLPPNALRIDLSGNGFTGGVPYSITQMTDLNYLNLGHNQLNGQLSDMFGKLNKLTTLDLSLNSLSGNLPQSFGSLSSLTTLNLQNNQFTGPIDVLASLPLDDLNIENNQFSGWIPDDLKNINSLETGGNSWSSGSAPPPPPGMQRRPRASRKSTKGGAAKSGISGAAIAGIVVGVLVVLAILIALLVLKRRRSSHYVDEERLSQRRPFTPLESQELSNDSNRTDTSKDCGDFKPVDLSSTIDVNILQSSASFGLKPSPSLKPLPSKRVKSINDNEFENHLNVKRSTSVRTTSYSLADLQTATSNFATGRFLGQGSIGCVYKAKYADGKALAVKKIDSTFLHGQADDFPEIVSKISKIRHPNIAELVGYCSEQGHSMLIYEYFRNGSLHEFLHLSDEYSKPLTWNTRVRIALGTARAIQYLHETCSPPSIHKNIKSSNIFLDTELNPRLCDCGLASFHKDANLYLGPGYIAPECTKPKAYTMKSDVYSFGVVMLELLTGRMPFDSSKPSPEQSLVQWATKQLHDIDALEKMVDPGMCGLYPPKAISRFADIIALCVQTEPEFRPPMSEVVESLVRLVTVRV